MIEEEIDKDREGSGRKIKAKRCKEEILTEIKGKTDGEIEKACA